MKNVTHIMLTARLARRCLHSLAVICILAGAATAANISAIDKYAWSENWGWFNFAPTHGGVTVNATFLAGYAWHERFGWIKLGSSGGGPYGNSTASNWGVNRDGAGNLSGYAWSENMGWLNFAPTHGGVSINANSGAFSGYAWGERLGWVNFSSPSSIYKVVYNIAPATAPVTVTVSPLSSSSMSLSWTPGNNNDCNFSSWNVRFASGGSGVPTGCSSITSQGTLSCIATGLNPATSYSYTVQEVCSNSSANSPASTPSVITATPPSGGTGGGTQVPVMGGWWLVPGVLAGLGLFARRRKE